MIVKRIGVLSVGKMFGCAYGLLGLIVGGFTTLFVVLGAAAGGANGAPSALLFGGAAAIVILPIFYGVGGFIGGVFAAALYNVVASLAGGIELELEPTPGPSARVDA